MSSLEKQQIEQQNLNLHSKQQFDYYYNELTRLTNISMLNDVFEIKTNDEVPSISKLKMGYCSESGTVAWEETNAGFGNLQLLQNYLIIRHGIISKLSQ